MSRSQPLSVRIVNARDRVVKHRQWLEEHGGSLAGYIARYGAASDPDHYGDGGEAIYAADKEVLAHAEGYLQDLLKIDNENVIAGLKRIRKDLES